MKKFTLFESVIIGFFVGVIVSTYIVFLDSTGRFVGTILKYVSLMPLFDKVPFLLNRGLLITFLCIVLVYVLYSLIVGLIVKFSNKGIYLLIFIAIVFLGMSFEQYFGSRKHLIKINEFVPVMNTITVKEKVSDKQYFGNEAVGDLNDDDKDDVAFLMSRPDEGEGVPYYLVAALSDENGHTGTNLIFLGYKLDPKMIEIENNQIAIEYIDQADKIATTTKIIYAEVVGTLLKRIKPVSATTTATSTVR